MRPTVVCSFLPEYNREGLLQVTWHSAVREKVTSNKVIPVWASALSHWKSLFPPVCLSPRERVISVILSYKPPGEFCFVKKKILTVNHSVCLDFFLMSQGKMNAVKRKEKVKLLIQYMQLWVLLEAHSPWNLLYWISPTVLWFIGDETQASHEKWCVEYLVTATKNQD